MSTTRTATANKTLDQLLKGYTTRSASRLANAPWRGSTSQWAGYAAAAGASLAMAPTADAAIRHIVPPNAIRLELQNNNASSTYQSTLVDFNDDGNFDMYFSISATTVLGTVGFKAAFAQSAGGNSAMLATTGTTGLALKLATGALISGAQPQGVLAAFRLESTIYGFDFTYGQFSGNGTGIAGIKFPIGGQNHFGWVRIALESNANGLNAMEIREWAYEDVPGASIRAGQVPEPSTAGLAALALGTAGVATLRRRLNNR